MVRTKHSQAWLRAVSSVLGVWGVAAVVFPLGSSSPCLGYSVSATHFS